MTSEIFGLYSMTGYGDEFAIGGGGSSAIGDEKPGCFGVGAVSHMLGNVSISALLRSMELAGAPCGGMGPGLVGVSSFA